jgi:tetraacyldisaccharide 4'-kinase
VLHLLYSRLARARRRYYERRSHLRRRLSSPVISIGNLTVGGSGKTPLAAAIARMLLDMGERPAILSRGYARRTPSDGVVVVSDGTGIQCDVDRSGDEPLMLARMVPHASVLVSPSRYGAGRVAESRLGCTVHVLDDGFQHFDLMRDIDLLVAPESLDDVRTLPNGRFREPIDAAASADALLIETPHATDVAQDFSPAAHAPSGRADTFAKSTVSAVASAKAEALRYNIERLNVSTAFEFSRRLAGRAADKPAFAFAGIARPERFFADLEQSGWRITGRKSFSDHHHYSFRDVEDIARRARESGAQIILTTEKDAVRLTASDSDLPIVAVSQEISIEPRFRAWLTERLRDIRAT